MFKFLFNKKPSFYLSRTDYYNSIITENSFIKAVFSRLGVLDELKQKTTVEILFNNKLPINCTYHDIVSEFGTPSFELLKCRYTKHKVLFYKKIIASYRVKFELHLVDEILIIGFQTFDISSTNDKFNVINSVFKKYEVEFEEVDLNKIKIHHDNSSYIKIIEGVNITLAYSKDTPANRELLMNLSNIREELEIARAKRQENNLLNNI